MHKERLTAGLRPDQLGEITALTRTPSCMCRAKERGKRHGVEGTGERRGGWGEVIEGTRVVRNGKEGKRMGMVISKSRRPWTTGV